MTDRPRMETRQQGEERLLEILEIVERDGPMTFLAILRKLDQTSFRCGERQLRRHIGLLLKRNRLAYDAEERMFAVKYEWTR